MNGSPLYFAHPEMVAVVWAWIALVLLLVFAERRGRSALDRLVGLALQDRLVDRPSRWRRWSRLGLLAIAGLSMAVALMQPQWGERYVSTPRVGAEIMIALDVSRSMLADDARPTRLERAKAEIRDLLSYLGDDYVGLIAFAGRASVLSPMTPDKSFLRLALDSAGPHSVSRGGTRLAEPIRRAVAGLGEPGPAQRALILITDGEDHDSFALDAARAAAEAGIKIIAIGFGDENGSPIYLRDSQTGARTQLRDADGQPVISRLNGELLRELALVTDGAFVPAGTGVLDLASIYDAHIAGLTRGQLDERGRTIRDETYQIFVLIALVCVLAAVLVSVGRTRSAGRSASGLLIALSFGVVAMAAPPPADAQLPGDGPLAEQTPDAREALGAADASAELPSEAAATETPGEASEETPRAQFNRGVEALAAGDAVAATTLFRAARRDAKGDLELRYAATYNLGMAAVARADGLATQNPRESLAALHEAADWFREAASARPDEADARLNLDVTLRRALMLSDELARAAAGEVEAELDALIESQRARVAVAARLLESVASDGDLAAVDRLRPAFADAATEQRVLLASADELAARIARERDAITAQPEESRMPEDALRAGQLDGALVYLDSALDRMGQTRRQLRQRRAERAYRRGSAALGELKRARDQLRDPVQQEESERLGNRVRELGARLQQASIDAEASAAAGATGAAVPDPASPGQPSPADRAALREALAEAAPRVVEAAEAMERTTQAIAVKRFIEALGDEAETDQQLARAQEAFFDLRQLLAVTHADESRIAELAGSEQAEVVAAREELAPGLRALQARNLSRAGRLVDLLARERDTRLRELEAQLAESALAPAPAPAPAAGAADAEDPLAIEAERFDRAQGLLALADGAMQQARDALGDEAKDAPEWPAVAGASARARDHLDAIRTLFFTIVEHLRQLAEDQVDTRDATQDAIALSATEASVDADGEPIARGPETRARATALHAEQTALEARAGVLADALLEQAEKQAAQAAASEPAPAPSEATASEPDRLRQAAEHVAAAQLAMRAAQGELAAEDRPLDPAEAEQQIAIEELAAAIEMLSPPPPPPEQGEQEQEQSEQEQEPSPESEQAGEPPEPGPPEPSGGSENAEQEAREQEPMGDPSQLLQGIRDREAERRQDRERAEQRQRSQPVDRDW